MMLRETIGNIVGGITAPYFGTVAALRRARVFHPQGIVFGAVAEPTARPSETHIAERLAGPVLVRFSTALWKNENEWPDALGCALRFHANEAPSAIPEEGDQDLLFATIRTPLATPFGPIGTNVHDFLANTYFATAPFDVEGVGRAKWRLVPERRATTSDQSRRGRLLDMVARGEARLQLQLRPTFHLHWRPVARITLISPVDVNQDQLRFWPFRDGRGITPRGFVHALRRGAYVASQRARPQR